MVKHTPLVTLVKNNKYLTFKNIYDIKTPMSMEIEIIEIYKGTEQRKAVKVWGDIGNLCRPYLSQFKEGQYYVIAFHKGNYAGGHPEEKNTDYSIFGCGAYWLNVDFKKNNATGDFDSKDRIDTTISLNALKAKF